MSDEFVGLPGTEGGPRYDLIWGQLATDVFNTLEPDIRAIVMVPVGRIYQDPCASGKYHRGIREYYTDFTHGNVIVTVAYSVNRRERRIRISALSAYVMPDWFMAIKKPTDPDAARD